MCASEPTPSFFTRNVLNVTMNGTGHIIIENIKSNYYQSLGQSGGNAI
jgi:hypothetical protein